MQSEPQRLEQWPVTIAFVLDPDGYLVELVERHPWPDDAPAGTPWLGQYCLNVTDIDATLAFYEALGLDVHQPHGDPPRLRGDPRAAREGRQAAARAAEGPGRADPDGFDVEALRQHRRLRGLHQAAVDAGHPSILAPMFLDRWNTTIAFVGDPDGYQVELVQRHPD